MLFFRLIYVFDQFIVSYLLDVAGSGQT